MFADVIELSNIFVLVTAPSALLFVTAPFAKSEFVICFIPENFTADIIYSAQI